MFHSIESLPLAYLMVLTWVVCANVLAKVLAPILVDGTSGWLQDVLSRRVGVTVTGDKIVYHLFEQQLLVQISTRLWIGLIEHLQRPPGDYTLAVVGVETISARKEQHFSNYWSGCPPNIR